MVTSTEKFNFWLFELRNNIKNNIFGYIWFQMTVNVHLCPIQAVLAGVCLAFYEVFVGNFVHNCTDLELIFYLLRGIYDSDVISKRHRSQNSGED